MRPLGVYHFYHDNLILEPSKKLHNSLSGAAHSIGFLSLSQALTLDKPPTGSVLCSSSVNRNSNVLPPSFSPHKELEEEFR